jgi:hypothetical protein
LWQHQDCCPERARILSFLFLNTLGVLSTPAFSLGTINSSVTFKFYLLHASQDRERFSFLLGKREFCIDTASSLDKAPAFYENAILHKVDDRHAHQTLEQVIFISGRSLVENIASDKLQELSPFSGSTIGNTQNLLVSKQKTEHCEYAARS